MLKIAPDLSNEQLLDIIEIVENTGIAGVIATNTTLSRTGLESIEKAEQGGLSGKPLRERATEVIRFLATHSNTNFPIIGVGEFIVLMMRWKSWKQGHPHPTVYGIHL